MLSLILSTVAFFIAGYYIRRYLDGIGVPRTMGRGLVVFVLAIGIAYGLAFVVDEIVALFG